MRRGGPSGRPASPGGNRDSFRASCSGRRFASVHRVIGGIRPAYSRRGLRSRQRRWRGTRRWSSSREVPAASRSGQHPNRLGQAGGDSRSRPCRIPRGACRGIFPRCPARESGGHDRRRRLPAPVQMGRSALAEQSCAAISDADESDAKGGRRSFFAGARVRESPRPAAARRQVVRRGKDCHMHYFK